MVRPSPISLLLRRGLTNNNQSPRRSWSPLRKQTYVCVAQIMGRLVSNRIVEMNMQRKRDETVGRFIFAEQTEGANKGQSESQVTRLGSHSLRAQ
jgi:hypothetical protein